MRKYIKAIISNNKSRIVYDKKYFSACREIGLEGENVFFGYYDLKSLNRNGSRALIHILDKDAKIGKDYIELATYDMDSGKIQIFGRTKAWSWQQGCRLRWDPIDDNKILYNDYDGDRYITRVFDLLSMKIVDTIPVALYDITYDGKYGLSLDFVRLQRLRPGYGYCCTEDLTRYEKAPKNTGIFLWNKEAKTTKLIISLSELAKSVGTSEVEHYINHISVSPSGKKFIFFHLWTHGLGTKWNMRLYICNIDGSDLRCIDDSEILSHYCWKGDNILLMTALANDNINHAKYIIYNLAKNNKKIIESSHLEEDGHPGFIGESYNFITDTYPHNDSMQYIFMSDVNGRKYKNLVSVYANPFLIDEYRCDLHPRVRDLENGWLSIDTTYKNLRRVIYFRGIKRYED